MKIKCYRKELSNILNKIGKIVESYRIHPAYSSLLIKAFEGTIIIEGSNPTSFISLQVTGKIFQEGSICVRAYDLINIVNNFLEDEIIISSSEEIVEISNKNTNISLAKLDEANFIAGFNSSSENIVNSFVVDSKSLQDALNKCVLFTDTTGILSGVNFVLKDNALQLCCGTNRAIAIIELDDVDTLSSEEVNFTLYAKGVASIGSIFEDKPVTVEVYEYFIKVVTENNSMYVKFLQGKYPNMKSLIPNDSKNNLPIVKEKFEQAFNLIDVVSETTTASIVYSKNKCSVNHGNLVNMNIEVNNDIEIIIKTDYSLLRKIFKSTKSNELELLFSEIQRPVMIKEDNCTFLLGLMI